MILFFFLTFLFISFPVRAATQNWDFASETNYTFDDTLIEFSGDKVQLIESGGNWYNPAWTHRKEIEIDNMSGGSLSDYQVKVSVTYDSDMHPSFNDIRFTDENGVTLLDYWLEEKTDSTSVIFWVKIPTIAATSVKNIYMYYGNSTAESLSNGENTFNFYDSFGEKKTEALSFAAFTSVEYGLQDLTKISAAVTDLNLWLPEFVIEVGDFIDYDDAGGSGSSALSIADLSTVEDVYDDLSMDRYYAFGNHDLDYISKSEFIANTGKTQKYESFDYNGYHFVILDASYSDVNGTDYDSGNFSYLNTYIPTVELTWLEQDLASTSYKTIIFVEQHLTNAAANLVIDNAADVMQILENSGKVLAVFSGHSGLNSFATLNGIDYYSLKAMDASTVNAYSKITVYDDDSLYVEGIGDQTTYGSQNDGYDESVKWDNDGTPVVTAVNGVLRVDSDTSSVWEGLTSKMTFNSGILTIKPGAALNSSVDRQTVIGLLKPSLSVGTRYGVLLSEHTNELRYYNGGSAVYFNSAYPTFPYQLSIRWDGSNFYYYYNDSQQWSTTFATSALKIVIESYLTNAIQLDWVYVRQYSAIEPSTLVGNEETLYSTLDPVIYPKSNLAFTSLSGFTETATKNGGEIKYQISNDSGVTWYWYNSGWETVSSGYIESNTATQVNANISSFPPSDGEFLFRAYLHSNGMQQIQLDSVLLDFVNDLTGPNLSNFEVLAEETSVTVTWQSDENASSKVDYGITDSYGSTTSEFNTSPRVSNHSIVLPSLVPCTTYHYRVRSLDSALNESVSINRTFTTPGCTGTADIDSESSASITKASGGSTSLLSNGSGIILNIPELFSNTDALFQIKKLESTSVINVTSTPTDLVIAGNHIYDLKALVDVSTTINTFNNTITVSITYNALDIANILESSLAIYRWNGSNWNKLTSCLVNEAINTVSCTTSAFSVFGLFGTESMKETDEESDLDDTPETAIQKILTPTKNYNSPVNIEKLSCQDDPPGEKVPNISRIEVKGTNSLLLYFTPGELPNNKYVLTYGTDSNNYPFLVHDLGVNEREEMSYLVKNLQPNTTYYFKIRGQNGCAEGEWSEVLFAKTDQLEKSKNDEKLNSENEKSEEENSNLLPLISYIFAGLLLFIFVGLKISSNKKE